MKIDRVLFCLNNNKLYHGFWDVVSKVWSQKYGIKPVLFYVGSREEAESLGLENGHGEVHILDSPSNVPTWAVPWSVFYGAANFFPDEVCVTSGIDQIPLGNHIIDLASQYDEEDYLVAFAEAYRRSDLFPSSHHVAKGSAYKKVHNIGENWEQEINKLSLCGTFWGVEEAYSSANLLVHKEDIKFPKDFFFKTWVAGRLERVGPYPPKYDLAGLKNGIYTEYHCHRPYTEYSAGIDKVVSDLLEPVNSDDGE